MKDDDAQPTTGAAFKIWIRFRRCSATLACARQCSNGYASGGHIALRLQRLRSPGSQRAAAFALPELNFTHEQ